MQRPINGVEFPKTNSQGFTIKSLWQNDHVILNVWDKESLINVSIDHIRDLYRCIVATVLVVLFEEFVEQMCQRILIYWR